MVFREMLGSDDARAYLRAQNVPPPVIERVLACDPTRNGAAEAARSATAPLPDLHNAFYCHSGRRRDTVKAAVVQAALTIDRELGRERAENLLRREGLADEVIVRLFAADGVRRRAR